MNIELSKLELHTLQQAISWMCSGLKEKKNAFGCDVYTRVLLLSAKLDRQMGDYNLLDACRDAKEIYEHTTKEELRKACLEAGLADYLDELDKRSINIKSL